eukprot:NODE_26742_length_539_cov_4.733010.p1 GENE.NODE_26742_length_539_cov_4.733010~~NODE_26742_length_539_cov_4.733010.p1  ORF type:complete len:135 (+),score=22.46 NODE_26742_length_539_cov_4.733010:48-452(+)
MGDQSNTEHERVSTPQTEEARHRVLIEHFMSIVPMREDQARALLARHNWDLVAAINSNFNQAPRPIGVPPPPPPPPPLSPSASLQQVFADMARLLPIRPPSRATRGEMNPVQAGCFAGAVLGLLAGLAVNICIL